MASYGGQQGDYGFSSQQQQRSHSKIINPQTGFPLEFHQQLTPQEVDTLVRIRRDAFLIRTTGGLMGASMTALYFIRKKRSLLSIRSFMGCFGGSIAGSWLTVPIGVTWSKNLVSKTDNPDHLVGVLRDVQQARMRAIEPERFPRSGGQGQRSSNQSGAPSMDPASQSMSSTYPPAPTPPPTRISARRKGAQTNQWGDEVNAPEMPSYSADAPNAPPAYQYSTPPNNLASNPNGTPEAESNNGSQSQSRWAQLRGQRQVQQSSWEKIRQENARDTYNKQAASGQGRPDQVAFSGGPDYAGQNNADIADPTFGKGPSPTRTQAQREYERSFERERSGVDR